MPSGLMFSLQNPVYILTILWSTTQQIHLWLKHCVGCDRETAKSHPDLFLFPGKCVHIFDSCLSFSSLISSFLFSSLSLQIASYYTIWNVKMKGTIILVSWKLMKYSVNDVWWLEWFSLFFLFSYLFCLFYLLFASSLVFFLALCSLVVFSLQCWCSSIEKSCTNNNNNCNINNSCSTCSCYNCCWRTFRLDSNRLDTVLITMCKTRVQHFQKSKT